jgi:carbamoyl-phosphate synthase large subunit
MVFAVFLRTFPMTGLFDSPPSNNVLDSNCDELLSTRRIAVNVLLSSIGRRVELARAFRRAYERLGMFGSIVGTDVDWLAPALQEVDVPCLVPRYSDADFIPRLAEICRENDVNAIFPLNDGELELLAANRDVIESTGAKVAGLDQQTVRNCSDKWTTFKFFTEMGLATPDTWLPESRSPSEMNYPVFMKPRNGSAAENTFRIETPEQYEFFANYIPNPVAQEFLPGPEITNDVICRIGGDVMAVISRQRIAVRGGEAIKSVTISDPRIEETCVEIARALNARGPFTVQCMMKNEVPHFVEINGRLGGGLPLAMGAGVDVPALLLSDLVGLSLNDLNVNARAGVFMTRCDESFFLGEESRNAIVSRHIRS